MKATASAIRRHIVVLNAQGFAPSEVIASVKETFGVEVSPQLVVRNNPLRASGAHLNKDLRELFDTVRAKVQEDLEGIDMAYRAVRMRALVRIHERATEKGDDALATKALMQMANEMDGLELVNLDPPAPFVSANPSGGNTW